MHIFISMTSDLIIIDQTSFPHERAAVIDYFPLHKTPVAANPSLSSLAHTWPHRPNRPKCNIALYIEHKNKMCRGACTLRYTKKIWGCPNSTCYTLPAKNKCRPMTINFLFTHTFSLTEMTIDLKEHNHAPYRMQKYIPQYPLMNLRYADLIKC